MEINYPITVETTLRYDSALKNEYWPALYFVRCAGAVSGSFRRGQH